MNVYACVCMCRCILLCICFCLRTGTYNFVSLLYVFVPFWHAIFQSKEPYSPEDFFSLSFIRTLLFFLNLNTLTYLKFSRVFRPFFCNVFFLLSSWNSTGFDCVSQIVNSLLSIEQYTRFVICLLKLSSKQFEKKAQNSSKHRELFFDIFCSMLKKDVRKKKFENITESRLNLCLLDWNWVSIECPWNLNAYCGPLLWTNKKYNITNKMNCNGEIQTFKGKVAMSLNDYTPSIFYVNSNCFSNWSEYLFHTFSSPYY